MKHGILALSVVGFLFLWGAESALPLSRRQGAKEEVMRFSRFYPLLNTRVRFEGRDRPSEIVVRIEGLRLDDVFVVRSQGDELSVSAGYVARGLAGLLPNGPDVRPLPSSCVRVEGATVSVRRPAEVDGLAFFEMSVPRGVRVHLMCDGETVFRARLGEPIALREGAIEPGPRNPAGTFVRALFGRNMPDVLRPPSPDQPYIASFRRLTIRKRVPVNIPTGGRLIVSLLIDADGTVAHIVPVEPEVMAPGVEQALRQWAFEPFVYEGQAIRVRTLAVIR